MKFKHQNNRGFTLVELLVVIAIIAILGALATPVIMDKLQDARVLKASSICTSLGNAINNFESEYNYLPYGGGTAPTMDTKVGSDTEIMTVLTGREDVVNFKKIAFFELGDRAKGNTPASYKNGMITTDDSAALYDIWGRGTGHEDAGVYQIIIDYDFDGEIEHPYDTGEVITGRNAVVYSLGPDRQIDTGNVRGEDNRDNASNFE